MAAKAPASEQLQKWILFCLGVVIAALGAGNMQMMGIQKEIGALNSTVTSLIKSVDGNTDRILRLEGIHFSREPERREKQALPPSEALKEDRRKARLE